MMHARYLLLAGLLFFLLQSACKKDEKVNPFDLAAEDSQGPTLPDPEMLEPDNFAYLHSKVFLPTCANSGCHDGTFEPDFRTISSAYNSIVYQPVIANDQDESFVFRVLPGNSNESFLHERLTVDVQGTSGMMPLEVDPGSDWPEKADEYITAIAAWINNGAKDMFDNLPQQGNNQPQVVGFWAYQSGGLDSVFLREEGPGVQPILIPQGNAVDFWFSFEDDSTSSSALQVNEFRMAESAFGFEGIDPTTLSIVDPVVLQGFSGEDKPFTHRISVDVSSYAPGTFLYVRVQVRDEDHDDPIEVPNDGTSEQIRTYFTIKIIEV